MINYYENQILKTKCKTCDHMDERVKCQLLPEGTIFDHKKNISKCELLVLYIQAFLAVVLFIFLIFLLIFTLFY